jgi:hypothetical protein
MTESAMPWNIIVGFLLSLVGGMIVFYLRSIKQFLDGMGTRLDKQDNRIDASQAEVNRMARQFAECKVDCERNTVSKEDWVRSEGYTRKEIKSITTILHRMEGKLEVVERLPEICGQIARQVTEQALKGDSHNAQQN